MLYGLTGFFGEGVYYECRVATFEIQAVIGSVITLTFSFLNLSDNYEVENIQVALLTNHSFT